MDDASVLLNYSFMLTEPDSLITDNGFDPCSICKTLHHNDGVRPWHRHFLLWDGIPNVFASSDAKPSVWHCEPSFASGFRAASLKSNCTSERLTAGRGVCCRGRDAQTGRSVSDVSHYRHRSGGLHREGETHRWQLNLEQTVMSSTQWQRGVFRHKNDGSRKWCHKGIHDMHSASEVLLESPSLLGETR